MSTALREAFRVTVHLSASYDVGRVPTGVRRVIPIVGGTIVGERLNGKVLPIGADWNLAQSDGVVYISARYMMQADSGALISILNEGWARMSDEAMGKIMAGEPAPAEGWYCKTHPRFEAADPQFAWLNEAVFICEMLPPPSADIVNLVFYELV